MATNQSKTQSILNGDRAALDEAVRQKRDADLAKLYQEYSSTKNPFKKLGSLFKMARTPRSSGSISDIDRTEAMQSSFQTSIEEELESKWAPVRPIAEQINNGLMEEHTKKVPQKLNVKDMGKGASAPGSTLVNVTPDPTKPPAHPPIPKLLKVPTKKDIKVAAKELSDEEVIERLMEKVKKPSAADRLNETVDALSRGILLGVDTDTRSALVKEATNRKYPKGAIQKGTETVLEFGGMFIPYVGLEYGTVKIANTLRSANAIDDFFKAYPYLSRVATTNAGVAVADYAWREGTGQEYGAKDFLLNIGFQGIFDAVPVLTNSRTRILAHIDEEIRTLTQELKRAPTPEEFLVRIQDRPIPGVSNYTYGKLFAEQRLAYRSGIDPNTGMPPEGRPGIDRPAPLPEPKALPQGRQVVKEATGNPEEIVTGLRVEKINEINSQQALRQVLIDNPDILHSRTRGVIGDTELYEKAARKEYTPSQVLSLKEGTILPAEDIIAVRQAVDAHGKETNLLKSLAEKELLYDASSTEYQRAFVQAKIEHAQLRARVKGLATEAGRAVRSFRLQTDPYTALQKQVDNMITSLDDDLARAMALDVARIADGDDAAMLKIIREYSNPRFWGTIRELGVMGKLWSPITHAVNTTSNATWNLLGIPSFKAITAGVDTVRSAVTGAPRERFLSEAGADLAGQFGPGARQALKGVRDIPKALRDKIRLYNRNLKPAERAELEARQATTLRSLGEVWNALLDEYYVPSNSKVEELVGRIPAIKGRAGKDTVADRAANIAGKGVRLPGRLLNAEDLVFRTMAFHGEMGSMAARQASKEGLRGAAHKRRVAELMANPSDEMRTRASDMATDRVFQTELGEFGKKIDALRHVPFWGDLMTVTVLPFLRTPINLTKKSVKPFSPGNIRSMRAGGGESSEAIARTVVAGTTGAMFVKLAMDGTITGPPPRDQKLREELYNQGWQPWSIRVGDQYLSYNRIEPLNSTLRWAGIAAEAYRESQSFDDPSVASSLGEITKHIAIGTLDKTYLSGMHDFLDALFGYNDTNLGDWFQRNAYSFVPGSGLLNATTQMLDEAPDGGQIIRDPESFIEYFQSRIPGLQGNVKPKVDSEGRLATKGGSPLERFISPVQRDTARKSKQEITELINDWNEVKRFFNVEDSQRAVYQNEAIKLIEQWENEGWDARRKNAEFRALQRANPPVADALESILSKDDPGLDLIEEKLKGARVDQRVSYIEAKLKELETAQEKNAFYKDLEKKKIITPAVIEALVERGVLPKSYLQSTRSRSRSR